MPTTIATTISQNTHFSARPPTGTALSNDVAQAKSADAFLDLSDCIILHLNGQDTTKYRCTVCQMNMSSGSVQAHLASTKHKRKEARRSSMESTVLNDECIIRNDDPATKDAAIYRCKHCQVPLSGEDQAKAHLDGKSHLKKLKILNI